MSTSTRTPRHKAPHAYLSSPRKAVASPSNPPVPKILTLTAEELATSTNSKLREYIKDNKIFISSANDGTSLLDADATRFSILVDNRYILDASKISEALITLPSAPNTTKKASDTQRLDPNIAVEAVTKYEQSLHGLFTSAITTAINNQHLEERGISKERASKATVKFTVANHTVHATSRISLYGFQYPATENTPAYRMRADIEIEYEFVPQQGYKLTQATITGPDRNAVKLALLHDSIALNQETRADLIRQQMRQHIERLSQSPTFKKQPHLLLPDVEKFLQLFPEATREQFTDKNKLAQLICTFLSQPIWTKRTLGPLVRAETLHRLESLLIQDPPKAIKHLELIQTMLLQHKKHANSSPALSKTWYQKIYQAIKNWWTSAQTPAADTSAPALNVTAAPVSTATPVVEKTSSFASAASTDAPAPAQATASVFAPANALTEFKSRLTPLIIPAEDSAMISASPKMAQVICSLSPRPSSDRDNAVVPTL